MEIYHPKEEEVLREMRRVRRKAKRNRLSWGLLVWMTLAAAAGWFIFNRYYTLAWVRGPGMSDTILSGSLLVCSRNNGEQPRQGDIVLYEHGDEWQVKRVIALEGDRVVVSRFGEVRINGRVLEEDYTSGQAADTGIVARRVSVPERELFVMGDQRSLSVDSRSSAFGTIKEESVIATARYVIWPLYRVGALRNPFAEEAPEPTENTEAPTDEGGGTA